MSFWRGARRFSPGRGPFRFGRRGSPAVRGRTRPGADRAAARGGELGAATIEFAFGLMFIFLIFIAYVKISEIFLAHSRLR